MYRVEDPVFAMAESYFLDGGSRLDKLNKKSLAQIHSTVSEWRSIAILKTNVPDVGRCQNECGPAHRAERIGPTAHR